MPAAGLVDIFMGLEMPDWISPAQAIARWPAALDRPGCARHRALRAAGLGPIRHPSLAPPIAIIAYMQNMHSSQHQVQAPCCCLAICRQLNCARGFIGDLLASACYSFRSVGTPTKLQSPCHAGTYRRPQLFATLSMSDDPDTVVTTKT